MINNYGISICISILSVCDTFDLLNQIIKANVFDKPREELHFGHFLSKPFWYHVFVHDSHPTSVEQAWQAIIGGSTGVILQIEHENASSNAFIKERLNLWRNANSLNLAISCFTSCTSSTRFWMLSSKPALLSGSVDLFLFAFGWGSSSLCLLSNSIFGTAKNFREPIRQKDKPETKRSDEIQNIHVVIQSDCFI